MTTMRVVQVSTPNGPFELVERERPEPASKAVCVAVEACGVCHSDPPDVAPEAGFTATLRRTECSGSFAKCFGAVRWPPTISSDDPMGSLVPVGRRMSGATPIKIIDADGHTHAAMGEGFFSGHQVFILIRAVLDPRATRVFVPSHLR